MDEGHFLSTVAHLGNVALRAGERIVWDAAREQVVGSPAAQALTTVAYRPPWQLPSVTTG